MAIHVNDNLFIQIHLTIYEMKYPILFTLLVFLPISLFILHYSTTNPRIFTSHAIHISFAQDSNNNATNTTMPKSNTKTNGSGIGTGEIDTVVSIPKGSANPEIDITKPAPKEWYKPNRVTVTVNDTVRWINNDTEPHTVTSGIGGGLNSLLTNSQGKPNGLFDSGLFSFGSSVSLKFNKSGTYNYFCTVHPWMEGTVNVKNESKAIPSYAVDEFGNKIDGFPLYNFTKNGEVEIGLSWSPKSITTNGPTSFIIDFFKYPQNSRLHLWPYSFVLVQGGKEIYRTSGLSQVGSSAQSFSFANPGQTIIKIESADNPSSFVQFGTVVYGNPQGNANEKPQNISNQSFNLISPLTLIYLVYAVVIGIPVAAAILIVLIRKNKI
jgi:plastocyanin